jgi:hypothetical protein
VHLCQFLACQSRPPRGESKLPNTLLPAWRAITGSRLGSTFKSVVILLSNNLSANAHGNGYADPNILVPAVIKNVQVDGGAFNVREGNHSQNLSETYGLLPRLDPFMTLTGDYRDLDLVAGWSPDVRS